MPNEATLLTAAYATRLLSGQTYVPLIVPDHTSTTGWRQTLVPYSPPLTPHGCVCPPGSEATCQGLGCPRRGVKLT